MSRTAAALAISALVVAGCSKETTTWENTKCKVSAAPTLKLDGAEAPKWTACRAVYLAEVASIPAALTFQLLAEGSGSFVDPGPGWLTVTVTDIENASGTIPVKGNAESTDAAAEIRYEPASQGAPGAWFSSGTLQITGSVLDAYGDLDSSSQFEFKARVAAGNADGSASLDGEIGIYAYQEPPADPTPDGSKNPTCDQAKCKTYEGQCTATAQAPCYCAAACLCKCSGDATCESQNRASAQKLGTVCAY